MRAKHIILVVFLSLIAFNSLIGVVISAYEMSTCLLVDLSICLSGGLFYYLFASQLEGGFKVSMPFILGITGLVRTVCMAIMETDLHDNVPFLIAVCIFLLEIVLICLVSYLSNK